jgi:Lar family restriction alleviation protein
MITKEKEDEQMEYEHDTRELRPCPFCGGKALISRTYSERNKAYYAFISCARCRIRGRSFKSYDDPLENWNENPAAYRATIAWNERAPEQNTDIEEPAE